MAQQAHNVEMTSYWRRSDVITSMRRQSDVIPTSYASWEMDGTHSQPAGGTLYRYNNDTYVLCTFGHIVCLLLDAHFDVGTAYMIQQYIFAAFLSLTEKNKVWNTTEGFFYQEASCRLQHQTTDWTIVNRPCTFHKLVLTWDGWWWWLGLLFNDSWDSISTELLRERERERGVKKMNR